MASRQKQFVRRADRAVWAGIHFVNFPTRGNDRAVRAFLTSRTVGNGGQLESDQFGGTASRDRQRAVTVNETPPPTAGQRRLRPTRGVNSADDRQ